MRVLITGGAGFIGSHSVRGLIARGHQVRVLDSLVAQVHGHGSTTAGSLPGDVEFVHGDVRSSASLRSALEGCEAIVHLAAEVGVGQSMYEIVRYVSANALGTASLLQILADGDHSVRKLVVASSMSVYGEGAYVCDACGPVAVHPRGSRQLSEHQWEAVCPTCGRVAAPCLTREEKPLQPTSVYAISKRDQEELCVSVGRAYGIPTIALRFFNVYGPGQSLSNPYTGVAAIFASRLLAGKAPLVYEDGGQTRDLVHISDVVDALTLAIEDSATEIGVFNIGSGTARSVLEVAETLREALGSALAPVVVNRYREGDIRHCVADISKARLVLGYQPRASFSKGVAELAEWVRLQPSIDRVDAAISELEQRGLTK